MHARLPSATYPLRTQRTGRVATRRALIMCRSFPQASSCNLHVPSLSREHIGINRRPSNLRSCLAVPGACTPGRCRQPAPSPFDVVGLQQSAALGDLCSQSRSHCVLASRRAMVLQLAVAMPGVAGGASPDRSQITPPTAPDTVALDTDTDCDWWFVRGGGDSGARLGLSTLYQGLLFQASNVCARHCLSGNPDSETGVLLTVCCCPRATIAGTVSGRLSSQHCTTHNV
ncbi:hypothetical protein PYCCODRAFT_5129 [Trametes coccinea BRFM310]|uniref:Uncharacterized protein n=1 Tax=Trametes coccinea (strain BRFM310) TaxID=1353009 RepID=A0A1Y2J4B4_TRAC3|nr:hypothetical protein PYCCODRAFT_5129 [Trametes coccinea BRFM310]